MGVSAGSLHRVIIGNTPVPSGAPDKSRKYETPINQVKKIQRFYFILKQIHKQYILKNIKIFL